MRTRVALLSTIASLLLAIPVFANPVIKGSGPRVTVSDQSQGYTHLQVSSAFKVRIIHGDQCKAEVSVPETIRPYVHIERKGDALAVYLNNENVELQNPDAQLTVTLPTLERLDLKGACSAVLEGTWSSPRLTLEIAGASKVQGTAEVETLDGRVSGASSLELAGKADTVRMECSGAAHFNASQLRTKDMNLSLSGATHANVQATGTVAGDVTGCAELQVSGHPKMNVHSTRMSKVKAL